MFNDKMFIKELSAKIKKMLKTKKEKAKLKKKLHYMNILKVLLREVSFV